MDLEKLEFFRPLGFETSGRAARCLSLYRLFFKDIYCTQYIQRVCLFVFLALQPTVVVFSLPGSGLYPPRV
jgi:hypothetical protein